MDFPATSLTNSTSVLEYYVQIHCTEFCRNWTINVDSTGRNSFTPLKRHSFYWADFRKTIPKYGFGHSCVAFSFRNEVEM